MCVQYALCIPQKYALIDSCRYVTVDFLLAFATAMKTNAGSPFPSLTLIYVFLFCQLFPTILVSSGRRSAYGISECIQYSENYRFHFDNQIDFRNIPISNIYSE